MRLEQSGSQTSRVTAECFFKAEDETEDELRHMGYHRLLTLYPTAHLAAGTGVDPAELDEVFLEVCRQREPGSTACGVTVPPRRFSFICS